jgi:FkbM family methyltransferase
MQEHSQSVNGRLRTRHFLARLVRATLGTSFSAKLGRFLLNTARYDGQNDSRINGEFRYLQSIIEPAIQQGDEVLVFDIGANIGVYSEFAAKLLGKRGTVVAVEPCHETYRQLGENLKTHADSVRLLNIAFSDSDGQGILHVVAAGAGVNSLVGSNENASSKESVQLMTLDAYVKQQGIKKIDFIKIDTEGHDLSVLRGGRECLKAGTIKALQFEYNWRWIGQRAFLKDVFELIREVDYRIGKVTCDGIAFCEKWEPFMETLVENNYAIVRNDMIPLLRSVRLAQV